MAAGWSSEPRADAARRRWDGERAAREITSPDWRQDDAVAVAALRAPLPGAAGMADLLDGYFHDRQATWTLRLCALPSGRLLSERIVRDAAYWRRLQELFDPPPGGG